MHPLPLLPLLPLLLAAMRLLPCDAATSSAAHPPPPVEVFNFDYTWSPTRPVASDTVVFSATAAGQSGSEPGWNLTDDSSFRWYQQLPGVGFHLRHVGRSYTRNASDTYFDGRYRLRVLVERRRRPAEREQAWDSDLLVDIVKYVGVQKQVDIALLTNATGINGSSSGGGDDRSLVCRFWGWPLVDSLQFLPAPGSLCNRQHFETAEAEPHIDLVIRCPRLLPGAYSCYGRNAVSASQLACELTGPDLTVASCHRPSLSETNEAAVARDAPSARSTGARSSEPKSRLGVGATATASGEIRGARVSLAAIAMATAGLATLLAIMR